MDTAEIRNEIKRLEASETTYPNCSKLAVLYTVLNNTADGSVTHKDCREAAPRMSDDYSYADSQFMRVCSVQPIEKILRVMDQHMQAVELLYPKEYRAIIKKLNE